MTTLDVSAAIKKAEAATASSNWEQAARAWQEVTRCAPDHPGCFSKASLALRKLGRFDESDAMIMAAISDLGGRPGFYTILGETAMERKDWRKALAHWSDLRRVAPKRPRGYFRAAQAHLALGEPRKAEAICTEGLAALPKDKIILLRHAEAALRLGTPKVALARLDLALRHHPGDAMLLQRRAEIARKSAPATPARRANAKLPPKSVMGRVKSVLRSMVKRARPAPAARPTVPLRPAQPASPVEASGLPAPQPSMEGAAKPQAKELGRQLTELQRQGSKAKLQERIDAARAAWETRLALPEHAGLMRLFDRAATDPRLAKILAGETHLNPPRAPGDPIRVVFFFPRVTQTDNLMPLFEAMHADPRFCAMILCCRTKDKSQADAYEFYSQKYPASEGYQVIDGGAHVNSNISFYELDADLVFYHTPYSLNAQRPFYLRADFAARHCRVANVTYGYPLLSLDTSSHHVYAGGHVKTCDMIFAESPACIEPYGRHLDKARIHVTGYTKVDEFRRHLDPTPFETLAARTPRLDVMWTPHWQLPGDPKGDTETSNFLRYYKTMLKVAARPDVLLHVRPHPLLRQRLSNLDIMSFRKYDAIMEQFRKAGAEVYPAEEGVSYVPALMQAAVLISDFSSLVAEYTITNRPIIFCRTDDVWNNGKWIGDFGKALIENCSYVVDDEAGLEASLETILTTRRHPKAERMARFVAENELFPEGSAAERICNVVESRLRA